MAEPSARRWVVEGRVQGVGFRWFVVQRARALGLSGWVANRDDGSVEARAKGQTDLLDQLEAALRQGPPGAHVTRVAIQDVPHESVDANSFSVKH